MITNKIILGDCIKKMSEMPSGKVELIFSDPPYNIGVKYDVCNDKIKHDDYVSWSEKWIKECVRILKPNGSIYVAINDEHAAEIVMILKKFGLTMRNWIIWTYSFGRATQKKFSRSHTHVLYFTKHKKNFVFNSDEIRIKSTRQKIGDKRANPKGKLPDDVWDIPRIVGNFKERMNEVPNQIPVKLMERIIKVSSDKNDLVFDPFCGSGTTAYVSKKLGRKYLSMEISSKYKKMAENRINSEIQTKSEKFIKD